MKKLYILKVGITFSDIMKEYGDFDDWICSFVQNEEIEVIDVLNNEELPQTENVLGVIITGSHAMVTQELAWSLKVETYIQQLIKEAIPLLGICYGHQLLAKAMGGKVDFHPKGMELGSVEVCACKEARRDALFQNLSQKFYVHVVHAQSVLELPKDALLLASNAFEKHHAFRLGDCAWGVQFHPEYNKNVMDAYIKEIQKETPEAPFYATKETSEANTLLSLFAQYAKEYNA